MASASQAALSAVPETNTFVFDSALRSEPPALSDPVLSSDNLSSSVTDSFLTDTSNLLNFHRSELPASLFSQIITPTAATVSNPSSIPESTTDAVCSPLVSSAAIQTDEQRQAMTLLEKEFGTEHI